MSNPVWPPELSTAIRIGWQGKPREMSKRQQMSRPNIEKIMQIASRCILDYEGEVLVRSYDEFQILLDFWSSDCSGGSLPFDWKYPYDGAQPASFYWNSPPQFGNVNQTGLYRVQISMRDA